MAHKAVPMKYLRGSVTQGGADAYAQTTITTGLSGETSKCYRVLELDIEWSLLGGDAADHCEFQITRKSFAASTNIAEKALIFKRKQVLSMTTSGAVLQQYVFHYDFPHDDGDRFLVVEDPLYFAIDTTAVGTVTAYFNIGYEEVSIAPNDRLTLLYNSLS